MARWLFRLARVLARSPFARLLIGWIFTHMSFAIPVNRLHETLTLLAFHHPKPAYALHILIVPKRPLAALTDLRPDDADFMADVFATAARLVAQFGLERCGYRLIANGGAYQDIPHLHFHLIAPDWRA